MTWDRKVMGTIKLDFTVSVCANREEDARRLALEEIARQWGCGANSVTIKAVTPAGDWPPPEMRDDDEENDDA
jgi:hypothetical protein